MKLEHKPARVIYESQGYRIRQIGDSSKTTNRYGVYAGKNLVNSKDGYESLEKAKEVIEQLIAGTITKTLIKKNSR